MTISSTSKLKSNPKSNLLPTWIQFRRLPTFVVIPSIILGISLCLPSAYLIGSAITNGRELWDVLATSRTMELLANTIVLVFAVSICSLLVSVPIAWVTTRSNIPFRRFWVVITILPLVIPSYVGGFIMILTLGPKGALQSFLGVNELPSIYGFSGALITLTLLSFPYALLPIRAALIRMDTSLEEASLMLGKSKLSTFANITIPHLRTSMAAGTMLVALYTLSDFGAVSMLRYETFTWAIYVQYESMFDRTMASGLSMILVAIAIVFLIGESRTRSANENYQSLKGTLRPVKIIDIGKWKLAAVSFCTAIASLSLFMPIAMLAYWAVGIWGKEGFMIDLWKVSYNSLAISIAATIVTVLAATPIAIMTVKYQGKFSSILEKLTYTSFALPGIVVAISLVYFAVHHANPIYQTHLLLIFSYLVLFIPMAMGAIRTSLIQINSNLEESARSLGSSPFKAFFSITLPIIRPGILSGAALVFLLCMKELPATLILSPIGFTTLATSIWSTAEEAFFGQAAIASLILISLSAIPMLFLTSERERNS